MQVDPSVTKSMPSFTPPAVSDQLEQVFLEEMLKYCGPKNLSGAFGGGIGEDQFSTFLIREHAAILARQMDLGFGHGISR